MGLLLDRSFVVKWGVYVGGGVLCSVCARRRQSFDDIEKNSVDMNKVNESCCT